MFTFFHRTPVIHIDAFTYSSNVYEYVPLIEANRALPDFWKELENPDPVSRIDPDRGYVVERKSTLKNCRGMIELYKRGFIVENWSDISLSVDANGYYFYHIDLDRPQTHPISQFGKGFSEFSHLKLISPWLIKEKTGVMFHCAPTLWSHEKYDFIIPPGVLDFKTNHAINVNIMLRRKEQPYEIVIEFGQPLYHLVPLSDQKIKLKNHLVSQPEFDKLKIHHANSFWGWRRIDKLVKRNNERKKKCPFGFSG